MRWSLIAAVNNERVLANSLLRSPDLTSASDVTLKRGFASAGFAYNAGMAESSGAVLVFAHQDVYLPRGWISSLAAQIRQIETLDDRWGVLGVYGTEHDGGRVGHVYSTGLKGVLGEPFTPPRRVRSVDEMLLVLRRHTGLKFDPQLPGFHLYGTDICLEAARRGWNCHVISTYCVHNSNGLGDNLPASFWRAYRYMRGKWCAELPIVTPCITINSSTFTIFSHIVRGLYYRWTGQERIGQRVDDPEQFCPSVPLESDELQANP